MSLYSSLTQVLAPFAAKINGLLTGWDGTKYSTPGEAVRDQIWKLHVLIGDEPGTAISASAISYGDSDVGTELTNVNGRLGDVRADLDAVVLDNILYSADSVTLSGTRYVYQDIFTLDNVDTSKQYTLHIESATGVTNSTPAYIRLFNSNDEQISQSGVGTTYPVDKTVTPTAQTAKIVFRLYASGATALDGDAVYTDVKVLEGTEVKRVINDDIGYARLEEVESDIAKLAVSDAVTDNLSFALSTQHLYEKVRFERGSLASDGVTNTSNSTRARTDFIPVKSGYKIKANLTNLSTTYRWYIWKFDVSKTLVTTHGAIDITEHYAINFNGYIRITIARRDAEPMSNEDIITLTSNIIIETIGGQNIAEYAEQLDDIVSSLSTIPSYWSSDLANDIGKIQALDAQVGSSGDSFVFITDTHVESNAMVSPRLISNILKKTAVDKVVHGGDIFQSDYTKAGAISKMFSWFAQMHDARRYYQVRGNHDINDSIDGVSSAEYLTDSEYYGVCVKRSADYIENDNCLPYYYFDNTVQKIRYFVLDTGSRTTENVSTYFNTQLSWMENLIDALDDTWSIVVFLHIMFVPKTSDNVGDLVLSDRGTLLKTKLDTLYGRPGKPLIIGVVAGHVHRDYSAVSSVGYPIIATSCDTSGTIATDYDPVNTDRTHGTVNEQLFDVCHIDKANRKIYMTRIGAGLDREFTY